MPDLAAASTGRPASSNMGKQTLEGVPSCGGNLPTSMGRLIARVGVGSSGSAYGGRGLGGSDYRSGYVAA